jgi:hypothetical protein
MEPELDAERKDQDLWKAESIAASLGDLGLSAWAPGKNDLAAGKAELEKLAQSAAAKPLGLSSDRTTTVVDVGGQKVGLAGVSITGLGTEDASELLKKGLAELGRAGASIKVALVAVPRGDALRLAEKVPGFHVFVVGRPQSEGDTNDGPVPPTRIGSTLVVQTPNHLQALAVVDLFVRDGSLEFRDGTGIEFQEKKASLERRIQELERRVEAWKKADNINPADLKARQADLARLKHEAETMKPPAPADEGSFFRYELRDVRESLGSSSSVAARMGDYYKRVNEHNRVLFKDRRPVAVESGQAKFVGVGECENCHDEAATFWRTTGHAGAYKTLSDDHKEFNLDCVSCHVTGYERPGGSTVTFVEGLKDVQCEECHGPGSLHVEDDQREDVITLTPPKDLCVKCHHPPHVHDDWDVEEAWTHIIGPGHGKPLAKKDESGPSEKKLD